MSDRIKLEKIRTNGGTQPRAELDESTWKEYAEAMTEGATFPPVTVYHDGAEYWLADGFHRVQAARHIGMVEIAAEVRQGSRRDAILHSVGANADHGLRRTNKDKRRAVETLLRDEEWRQWSDREIARRCAVGHAFVSKVRGESSLSTEDSEPRTYTTKHGTTARMNTENIGRREERTTTTTTFYEPDDELEDDEPEEFEEQSSVEVDNPFHGNANGALRWIKAYINDMLEEVAEPSAQHEVVNELIKWLRTMSVDMHRRA